MQDPTGFSSDYKKVVTWDNPMTVLHEDWAEARGRIFNCVISAENITSEKGSFSSVEDAHGRCYQCGILFHFVRFGMRYGIHSCPVFYDQKIWNGQFFEPASPMEK